MRIFVTGGTGFVGGHFINLALQRGHSVVALRRASARPRVPCVGTPTWIEGSLDDVQPTAFAGCEALVHLAAAGVTRPQSWRTCFDVNVTRSLGLWQTACDAGITKFVIAGSCFEYGHSADQFEAIPPTAPLEPIDAYSASKAASSLAACAFAREHELKLIVLRLFHVFGEGEAETRFWPSMRKAALAGHDFPMTAGAQIRDFIPVATAAGVFLKAVQYEGLCPGKPVIQNVGTGRATTLRDFAAHWWAKLGATGHIQAGVLQPRTNEMQRYVPCTAGPLTW